jgi:VCBS repeat-containing protein
MTRSRHLLQSLVFACLAAFPLAAHGATTDFRVLFNDDNSAATGCLVAGMEGVDQILITRVETGESTAKVTSTFRQVCQNGALTAPVLLEGQTWNAGYDAESGELLAETRIPFSAFALHGMHKMRLGIDARQGSLSHVALTSNPGNAPVFFPSPSIGRRRAVGNPGEERVITLDGVDADWQGIKPKFDNIGSEGVVGLRMLKLFGYADVEHDYLYFLYEANVSGDVPFAAPDFYTRTVGQGLTVPGLQGDPTVLANDTDPNGLPLKATLVTPPPGGDVVLDENGGFVYMPTNPADTAEDSFEYMATNDAQDSNVAKVTISVDVPETNGVPTFTSTSTPSVLEGTTSVVTLTATDPENDPITFSIAGGADQARFTLVAGNQLRFVSAPDFEVPTSFGGGNVYVVTVTADDGQGGTTDQTITVTVTNLDEAPFFTSGSSFNVAENTTAVTTVVAQDPDGTTIAYAISGGADAAQFAINAATGVLTFLSAPDFESPADTGANNVYTVFVSATDGDSTVTNQTITVTVTDINEAPVFTSTATPSVPENTTAIMTVTAVDQESQPLTYSITGGLDQAFFSITTGGVLTFLAPRDFEAPADSGANNNYVVQVTATDGTNPVQQLIAVTVTNVNETPSFTSANTATVPENTIAAATVTTTDPDGNAITYSLTGGADQARFTINATSGLLSFNVAPNFEAPIDADANNQYVVQVTATDGTNPINQTLTITVTDVNEAPVFTSGATPSVVEGTTAVTTVTTTDQEGNAVTYSITGGVDQAFFSITSGGVLTFLAPRDFEAPADSGANNTYVVQVTATDGTNPVNQVLTVTVTDLNEAPAFTSSASPSVPENTTAVLTATTSDPENNSITYSITGGVDQAFFSITTGGVLTFLAAPNFEAPADSGANNTYVVQVTANDGTNNTNQTVTVTVTDVNEAPVITSGNTASVPENTTAVTTVTSTDQEGNTVTYTITGGADAAKFAVDLNTGVLTFLAAPNYDIPGDADANNQYVVQVTANDGTNTTNQTITVTVTDVNEAPAFTSGTTANVAENTTAVMTVTTFDPESAAIAYSITGGVDSAFFSINTSSGALTFLAAPNFEAPADSGADNTYVVQVTATDGTNPVNQTITVTVTNVNEAPSFTSSATPSVPENGVTVITVTTTDPEAQTVTYTITGGNDSALFSIDLNTGVLSFLAPPNYENPTDANANNQYEVDVTATDGTNPIVQSILVTVTDVNEAPSFTSSATPSVPENTTAVTTVTTTDPENNSITYSLTGGADQLKFSITTGGVLTFVSAPDFEVPTDADTNNVYLVQVTATDGTNPVVQNLSVTVTNQNDPPAFTSGNTANVPENTTAVTTVTTTDPEGQTVTYTITGGVDAALFSVGLNSGVLAFNAAPNFELPGDANADNQYIVQITATDGTNNVNQTITVTVTNVNEAPSFTSGNAFSVPENTTAITTVTTTDPEAQAVTYTLTGGVDQAFFSITSGGVLTFLAPRNFEAPADNGANNTYVVQVTGTDGTNPVNQTITVTITNVNEAPVITSGNAFSVPENTTAVTTVTTTDEEAQAITYTITGGADALKFAVGLNSGALTFLAAPDFDIPGDADANNQYIVQVTANDGTNNTNQTITVTVTNVNEAPSFTSGTAFNVPENTTAITTVTTTDPEAQAVTYTLTGGVDQAFFSITSGGVLTFLAPRNFEAPADNGANNTYVVQVTATDGTNPVNQTITVTITNVNEAPSFTSSATPSVPENTTAVTTVTTNDPEGAPVTYSITGGADQLHFSITTGGVLTFQSPKNFEAPADADANNIYLVDVTATDGTNPVVQSLSVTVTNVNEAPSFTSGASYTQAENTLAVTTVTTTDPEAQTVTYTVTGGADQALFSIGLNDGMLTFIAPPNFEVPTDVGGDNIYNVQVTATDGTNPVNQAITITITNVNEGPQFTSSATPSVPENTTAVVTVTAPDPEGNAVTYTITGGADQLKFSVGLNSGALTFNAAPNFEAPTDAGANNVYDVQVTATDGSIPAVQNIAVTVTNVNEAPAFTSSATPSVPENTTAVITTVAVDPDGTTPTYSITGGADALKFSITGVGVLTFVSAPNFEAPTDADTNNVYLVQVTATDGTNPVVQSLSVTVTNVDEAPVFTSSATPSVPENTTAVITTVAVDPEGVTPTYSITGGADALKFSITGAGVLTFVSAPNFEIPTDVGTNNVYDVQVTATDGTNPVVQNIAVTVTNVNEAPVNVVPGGQTFNEDVNRVFNLANSNQISISDVDAGTNPVLMTLVATNGTLSTNGVAGLTFTPPGAGNDGVDDATLTFTGTIANINTALNGLTYKPTANYYGAAQITITTDDQGNTGSGGALQDSDPIALTISPVNDPPTATVKTHTTHSGIGLTISAATHTGELKEGAADVDDHDPFSELTVQIVAGSVVPTGSTLTLIDASDGSFYFEPRGGVSGVGSGSFQFQVCDDGSVPLGLAPACSVATTVTFNITGPDLWFVDDTDASGCGVNCNGSRTKPLVGLNNVNANYTARGTGDKVFVFSGTYNHGHTFAASEQLIGQASSGAFDTILGISVPGNGTLDTRPSLSGAAVTLQNTVTAAASTLMRGIAIASTGNGYVGTGATSVTVLESSVSAAGKAIDLTNSGASASGITFTSTSSSAGTHGISLQNVTGVLAFGTGSLSGNTTAAFFLKDANASTITYSGNMAPTGAGRGVLIGTADGNSGVNASNGLEAGSAVTLSGNITAGGVAVYESSGGTLNLSGTTHTFSTGAVNAVELIDNNGTTVNFSGGNLAITTVTGKGFLASQGGTVNVTGANNVVTSGNGLGSGSTGGTAVEVIGTAGEHMGGQYTFKTLNASFGVKGVSAVFFDGPFSITGTDGADAGTDPDAGTGGSINTMTNRGVELTNITGAVNVGGMNFTNAGTTNGVAATTCGDSSAGDNTNCAAAIHLLSASGGSTLNQISITGGNQMGVNTRTVSNLVIKNITVQNVGDETLENGMMLVNTTGTGSITNGNFHDNESRQVHMYNSTGTLSSFTIKGCNFANSAPPNGNMGLILEAAGASTTMNVTTGGLLAGEANTFSNLFSNSWHVTSANSATANFSLIGSSGTNSNSLAVAQASLSSNMSVTIDSNTWTSGVNQAGGPISLKTDGGGDMTATVTSNTLGTAGVVFSGSPASCGNCVGMFINPRFSTNSTITVKGNTIQGMNGSAIYVQPGEDTSYNVNTVITGNLIREPSTTTAVALDLRNGVSGAPVEGAGGCHAIVLGGSVTPGAWPSQTANAKNRIEGDWGTGTTNNEVILLQTDSSSLRLVGYPGTGVPAYVQSQNSITSTLTNGSGFNVTSVGTIAGGTGCP